MNSSEKMGLNEGRRSATDLLAAFITMLRTDKRIQTYLTSTDNDPYYQGRPGVRPKINVRGINNIGLRIDFWDENVDRIMPPYLAQIIFEGGNFYYYEGDPETLELKLISKESYQEAFKNSGTSFEINPQSIFDTSPTS